MSLKHAIGFEWNKWEDDITTSINVTIQNSYKRTGSYAVRFVCNTSDFFYWLKLPLAVALSEFYLQFALMFDGALSDTNGILKWCNGSTVLGGIKLTTDGKIDFYTGDFATLVASGSKTLTVGTWYLIEVHVKIADSGGVLETRVDLVSDAVYSGDTKPGTAAVVDNLVWGSTAQNTGNCYLDDIVVNDTAGEVNNSWPDNSKVVLLKPTADGSLLEWTPTPSGSHYSTVDEVPPSGTDYLSTQAVDKVDEFVLEDLPAEAKSIVGVIPEVWAYKGSSNPPTKLALGFDLWGTDYLGSDLNLGTAQQLAKVIYNVNEKPGGGSFTVADVNNAKLLIKSRS